MAQTRLIPQEFEARFAKKLAEIDKLADTVRGILETMPVDEHRELRDANLVRAARNSLGQEGIEIKPEEAVEQFVNCYVPGLPPETRKAIEGHFAADYLVQRWAERGKALTEDMILDTHTVLMSRTDPDYAGRYRQTRAIRPELPEGFRFPEPGDVPASVKGFLSRMETSDDHPLMRAVFTQLAVYRIHAFKDGNSRTSRLVQNMLLLRDGYLPVTVPEGLYVQHRKHLNAALTQGWEHKDGLFSFMLDLERQALTDFVRQHGPKQEGPVKDVNEADYAR